jgi:hypothetical protein
MCARPRRRIAQYRRARLLRVVVEEDVVAVSPKPRLAANEVPDFAHGRPPHRANRARLDLAPHRGHLAGINSLYVDGDQHSSNRQMDCSKPEGIRRALVGHLWRSDAGSGRH